MFLIPEEINKNLPCVKMKTFKLDWRDREVGGKNASHECG